MMCLASIKLTIFKFISRCFINENIRSFDIRFLTHISLASFLWDIGKQNSPRCDAAKRGVPSGASLFA